MIKRSIFFTALMAMLCGGCSFALKTAVGSLVYESQKFGGLGYMNRDGQGETRFGTSGDIFTEPGAQPDIIKYTE